MTRSRMVAGGSKMGPAWRRLQGGGAKAGPRLPAISWVGGGCRQLDVCVPPPRPTPVEMLKPESPK